MKSVLTLVVLIFLFTPVTLGGTELHNWEELTSLEGGTGPTRVIFVHGFRPGVFTDELLRALPVERWNKMARAITQTEELAEKLELWVFLYQPYFDDIPELAEKFASQIEKSPFAEEDLLIIAHSMGGLIARHYINYLGGGENVLALFTLGTPHKGIPLPFINEDIALGKAIMDLQGTEDLMERFGFYPENEMIYLQKLNEIEGYAHRYFNFSGKLDPSSNRNLLAYLGEAYYQLISSLQIPGDGIVPNYSSFLEKAHNFPPVEGANHQELLENEIIIAQIVAGLEGFLLDKKFQVFGRITGENGESLEGIKVRVGSTILYTDKHGFFRSGDKFQFGKEIRPEPEKGKDFFPSFQMVNGREEGYNFTMQETYTLAGKVRVFFSDEELQGSTLIFSSVENHLDFYRLDVGEGGSFRKEGIAPGKYRFVLYNKGVTCWSFREIEVEETTLNMDIGFFKLFNDKN